MDLEIIVAVITFVLGLIIGAIGRDKWKKGMEYLERGYKIVEEVSETIDKISVMTKDVAKLIEKVKTALEDGKITKEEAVEIITTWEELEKSYADVKEAVDELMNTILTGGGGGERT